MKFLFIKNYKGNYRFFSSLPVENIQIKFSRWKKVWELAKTKLDYVYLGNIQAENKSDTTCPSCEALLINRSGYATSMTENLHPQSTGSCTCKICGTQINVIM